MNPQLVLWYVPKVEQANVALFRDPLLEVVLAMLMQFSGFRETFPAHIADIRGNIIVDKVDVVPELLWSGER